MKEFTIVHSPRQDRIVEGVTKHLNDGWELHGNLFIGGTGEMVQALTRTTKQTTTKAAPKNAKVSE